MRSPDACRVYVTVSLCTKGKRGNCGCVSSQGSTRSIAAPVALARGRATCQAQSRASPWMKLSPLFAGKVNVRPAKVRRPPRTRLGVRSEEHTSELQSHVNIVCRLLLEKKKKQSAR